MEFLWYKILILADVKNLPKRRTEQENNKQSTIALLNDEAMLKQLLGSSPDEDLISPEGEED
eukprot:1651986-Ditylum_brightwellii.AAC.1